MNDYEKVATGAAIAAVAFFAAALGKLGRHLETVDKFTPWMIFRHLGLQLTLMPAAAAMGGWLVATQGWSPLSMIPVGLAAGWGGFALGDVLYNIFLSTVSKIVPPKE
jgi:hypothetical protein